VITRHIFTDNEFVIIPEPVGIWILGLLLMKINNAVNEF
jgi:hypothetical protein